MYEPPKIERGKVLEFNPSKRKVIPIRKFKEGSDENPRPTVRNLREPPKMPQFVQDLWYAIQGLAKFIDINRSDITLLWYEVNSIAEELEDQGILVPMKYDSKDYEPKPPT